MNIGSTPTHVITLPDSITTANIRNAQIVYSQSDDVVLRKEYSDITIATHTLTVTLTQAQTFLFAPKRVEIQVRLLMSDGQALASSTVTVPVQKCLDDLILTAVSTTT